MYNGSPEMTQGKDEQLIKKKMLLKIKFVTEGRTEPQTGVII